VPLRCRLTVPTSAAIGFAQCDMHNDATFARLLPVLRCKKAFENLHEEIKRRYPELRKKLPRDESKNHDREDIGQFSTFLQHVERQVALAMAQALQEQGKTVVAWLLQYPIPAHAWQTPSSSNGTIGIRSRTSSRKSSPAQLATLLARCLRPRDLEQKFSSVLAGRMRSSHRVILFSRVYMLKRFQVSLKRRSSRPPP